jgi:two-component system, LytTR family, response regulator AgrA
MLIIIKIIMLGVCILLKIVVCEDDKQILESTIQVIRKIIKTNSICGEVVLQTQNPGDIYAYIKTNKVNVFFLDIDLNSSETGYDIARNIRDLVPGAYIVFLTNHFEYVLQSFKVYTFDFLVKPVPDVVLEQCIMRIYDNYMAIGEKGDTSEDYISIKTGTSFHRIKQADIVYIERMGFKTVIYTVNSEISCYDTLESILEKLNGKYFVRCHKSFIANKLRIKCVELKAKKVIFETNHQCFIGPKYKKELSEFV